MAIQIQWETSGPGYASESDKERGANAYRQAIEESGLDPVLIRAADILRTDPGECPESLMTHYRALETAEHAAESAVTQGWQDQTADSGVSFWIDCQGVDVPDHAAALMDSDIRESLHGESVDCAGAFLAEYIKRHAEKYGAEFVVN